MSVELPFAPVDTIIRQNADGLRVSADAAAALAHLIQDRGAERAAEAAESATADGRKTLMTEDFGRSTAPDAEELTLPVAPVDRIARSDIDDKYRVSADARVVLAAELESYAAEVADGAESLARHAGRRTVQAEDIELYVELVE